MLPRALEKLISKLENLPGVGRKTAERYAYDLLKGNQSSARDIAKAIDGLHESIKYCPTTFALIEASQTESPLYTDPSRDRQVVAVVAQPYDLIALEKTGEFHGTYHVLKGLLSPIDGISPKDLTIDTLIKRVEEDKVSELIIAISGSVEGETTTLYIQKLLTDHNDLKITVLARGLPVGLDVEFADQVTLTQALAGRREINSE